MADSTRAQTLGQLDRTCKGATFLMHHLGNDATVLAAFDAWCAARQITKATFQQVWDGTTEMAGVLARSVADPAGARAQLTRVVRDELDSPLPWLPSALVKSFELWVVCGVLNRPRRIPALIPSPAAEATLELGRGPRGDFARDVAWYYRTRLKRPPDRAADLLREWKTQHPTTTSGENLITQARDRVHEWLNVPIVFSWDPPDNTSS